MQGPDVHVMVATHVTLYIIKIWDSSLIKALEKDVGTEVVSYDEISGGNVVIKIKGY